MHEGAAGGPWDAPEGNTISEIRLPVKTRVGMLRGAAIVGILAVLLVSWRVLSQPQTNPAGQGPGAAASGPGAGRPGEGAIPVVASRVRRKDMTEVLLVTGTLRTDEDVRVGSRIPGKVARVAVKEGDRVRPGDLLLVLDDSELRAQLARARGAHQAARARLSQLVNSRDYRITQLRKELERARSGLAAARAAVSQAQTQARITETETAARVQGAQADVSAARERLKILQDGARRQERRQAELAVAQAKAELDNARAFYGRRLQLFARGNIAREELDEAATRVKVAQAVHNAAVERQDIVFEGPRTEEIRMAAQELRAADEALREAEGQRQRQQVQEQEVRTAEARYEQAQAALDESLSAQTQDRVIDAEIRAAEAVVTQSQADIAYYETQLRDTRIYAPVAGAVTRRTVNVGESVTPSSVLLNLVALEAIYLETQVPERDLARVRTGMPASVIVDSLGGRRYSGTVREIIPAANPANMTFRVRVAVHGGRARGAPELPAGGFAHASIRVGRRPGALVVPAGAVRPETGEDYVYEIVRGRARRIPVRTGLKDATHREILGGLVEGQRIIAVASPALTDGAPVSAPE